MCVCVILYIYIYIYVCVCGCVCVCVCVCACVCIRALNYENFCQALRLATGSMTVREVVKSCSLYSVSRGKPLAMRVGSRIALFPPLIHYDESLFPASSQFRWRRYMSDDTPVPHMIGLFYLYTRSLLIGLFYLYPRYMSDDTPVPHTSTAHTSTAHAAAAHTATATQATPPHDTAAHNNSPQSVTPASSARPNALSRSVMPFGGACECVNVLLTCVPKMCS